MQLGFFIKVKFDMEVFLPGWGAIEPGVGADRIEDHYLLQPSPWLVTPNGDPDRRMRDIVETARLKLEEHLESARLRGSREQIGGIRHIYVLVSPGMQMAQLPPAPVFGEDLQMGAPHPHPLPEELVAKKLTSSRAFVDTAVKESLIWLHHASGELQRDRRLVLRALKHDRFSLQHVREHHPAVFEKLRRDRRVVQEALRHNSRVLGLASEELRADKRLVLFALAQNFAAFEFAHKDLQSSKRFVLCAVRVAGHALQYADASLRADGDVVLEAVRQKVYSMEFAADELKAVKAFILKAMSINSAVLELSAEVIKADKDFMLEALKLSTEALGRADETIKSDKEVVLRAIEQNTLEAYDAAGLALDKDVMQEAAYRKGPLCGEIIAEIKEARKLPFRSREPEWFVGLYTSKFS
eukprot:s5524_g4.t2